MGGCLRQKSESSAFGFRYFRGHRGSLALRPGNSLATLEDAFVNRLQDRQFPAVLLFMLRGLGLLPRWGSHLLVDASLHWTHTFSASLVSPVICLFPALKVTGGVP